MKQFDLDEYLKNPSRKVITRSGLSVLIKGIYLSNPNYPVKATINNQLTSNFTASGLSQLDRETEYDLFFVPEKHEGWMNLYKDGKNYCPGKLVYPTKEEAKHSAVLNEEYIETVKIEWEE